MTPEQTFWYFTCVSFVLGACWGSFLNVCIYRIQAGLSVVKPRSRCPQCMTDLAWKDNVPIFGWIFLGGKCRYCKNPISPRYPSIELLTAVLFAWIYIQYPVFSPEGALDFRGVAYALLVFGLLLASFVDLDDFWIPDRVSIGGMIVGPLLSLLIPALHNADGDLLVLAVCSGLDPALNLVETHAPAFVPHVISFIQSLMGLSVGFLSLWLVGKVGKLILKKDAMGFGDVKLMGTLGAFLGWQSVIFIVFMSSLLGTIVGLSLIALGKKELQSKIPFGPYISVAAIIWILGGYVWWQAYLNWMSHPAY